MQRGMIVKFSKMILPIMVLFFHTISYGIIAYIPQQLRDCINIVHATAEKSRNINNLEELYAMVMKENRILASDNLVRKAIKEALSVVRNNKNAFRHQEHNQAIEKYLQEYVNSLQDTSALLFMHSDKADFVSWPVSLMSRSIDSSVARDMICLSSELASRHNIQLCGNSDIVLPYNRFSQIRDILDDNFDDANTFMDCSLTLPTIMFGTGVASPIVNAWQMLPSYWEQFPIMMSFATKQHLNPNKNIMLELHFLFKQNVAPDGMARIRVDGAYMDGHGDFMNAEEIFTVDSNDFLVSEQVSSSNTLKHICIKIKLPKVMFKICNAVSLALTRTEPTTGVEYEDNLYLAAAVLRYSV